MSLLVSMLRVGSDETFGNISVSGTAVFLQTVTISGAAVLKTTLTVEGASTFSGAATFNTTVTMSGNAVAKSNLLVEGTTTLSGAATLKTTLNVEGDTSLSGNAVVKGNLLVEGTTTFSGTAVALTNFRVAGETSLDSKATLHYTATQDDDYALGISVAAGGFADVKAMDIDYVTGTLAAGEEDGVILVNINDTAATGGTVFGLEVITTPGNSESYALRAGAEVGAIEQLSGTFGDADSILNNAADVTAALASGGAGSVSVFVSDNDTVTVGDAAQFFELSFDIATPASANGIAPTFEYSTGVGTWNSFVPTDGTNGMRNTGVVVWDAGDVGSWAVGAGSEFLIRITRTRNTLATTPILDVIQIAATTQYAWDKSGNVNINALSASGAAVFSSTVSISGAAVLKTTLNVEGTTSLSGNAVAKGNLLVEGTTTLSGNAVAKGTLLVEGVATLSGGAVASGEVYTSDAFVAGVNQGNDITLNGTAYTTFFMSDSNSASDEFGIASTRHTDTGSLPATKGFLKSRGAHGSETIVADTDALGSLFFAGYDGADYALAARIDVVVNGTPGLNDMPGQILFKVSPDGSQTPATALQIDQDKKATFAGAFYAQDTATLSGAAVLKSTLTVEGAATISGAATFNTTVSISGAAVLQSTLNVEGATSLSGNAVAKGTLLVEGATTLSGAATLKGTVTLEGAAVAKSTLLAESTVTISGAAVLKTTLNVEGATSLSGNAVAKGNLLVEGTVTVSSSAIFKSSVVITGDVSANNFGAPNIIIGGNFTTNPWQRGTSSTSVASDSYLADRMRITFSNDGAFDVTKTADAPTIAQAGVYTQHCYHVDVRTADAAIAAGQYCAPLRYTVEGLDIAIAGFGQSNAKQITLSFWHKHTVTGTYCVAFRNSAADRSYIAEYTQSTTNTWEKATITITADTTGTWLYTNGAGLDMWFMSACGSTYQTSADTWTAGNYLGTSNQVNNIHDTADDFKIALLKLEIGAVATPYPFENETDVLARCQRYYETSYLAGVTPGTANTNGMVYYGINNTSTQVSQAPCPFKTQKRTSPTNTTYDELGASGKITLLTNGHGFTPDVTTNGTSGTGFGSPTSQSNAGMSFHYVSDAEL